MKKTNSQDQPSLIQEMYKQASEDRRFYGDMRFKQLTLFGILSALLLNTLNSQMPLVSSTKISIIGMASTALLWIMEIRSSIFAQAARKLKGSLEPSGIRNEGEFVHHWTFLNATNAVLVFYAAAFVSWDALFLKRGGHNWICGIGWSLWSR